MLKTRVMTACAGILVFILAVSFGDMVYNTLLLILALVGWSEYFRMLGARKIKTFGLWGVGHILLGMGSLVIGSYQWMAFFTVLSILGLFVVHIWNDKLVSIQNLSFTILGLVYVVGGLTSLSFLRDNRLFEMSSLQVSNSIDLGLLFTWLLFLCTWASDTCAYFAGRQWGKRKIVPTISPNKSLEGYIGGFLGTVLIGLIYVFIVGLPYHIGFVVGLLVGISAPLGDLFESKLKRFCHVKDSGTLLPGHGGVLDRFDSLLFAGPLVLVYVLLF